MSQFEATTFIESHYAHYIIFGCSTLGLVWGAVNAFWVSFERFATLKSQTRLKFKCLSHSMLLQLGKKS